MTNIDKKGNFLDLVPQRSCQWEKSGDGGIYLLVPRFKNRWMKKIALKLGKSEFVKVHFDNNGSNVWELIDGSKTVEQIGKLMETGKENGSDGNGKEQTGAKNQTIDRVYARLAEFLAILSKNRFIHFKNYS